MIKRMVTVLLLTLMINSICYAKWTDVLQNAADIISPNPYKNFYNALDTNPQVIELFAGLKSDSSIVDVINTFKNIDTVTTINLGSKYPNINFKNIPNTDNKIYETLANALSTSNIQSIELNNKKVNMPTKKFSVFIEKIYKDGVPYGVKIDFEPCAGFYYLYPSKVYQDSTGKVYPYVITNILAGSYNDMDTEQIVREKYGKPHLEYNYDNSKYFYAVGDTYQKFLNDKHVQENQKLDSGLKF